ncbi:MAG TPA: hypothetical protein PLL14_10100, partial [Accumulibacter sp.]|nr:hypothetical protein [Accumulibacter sp.]
MLHSPRLKSRGQRLVHAPQGFNTEPRRLVVDPQSLADTAPKLARPQPRPAGAQVGAARRSAGGGFAASAPAAVATAHRFAQGIERRAL